MTPVLTVLQKGEENVSLQWENINTFARGVLCSAETVMMKTKWIPVCLSRSKQSIKTVTPEKERRWLPSVTLWKVSRNECTRWGKHRNSSRRYNGQTFRPIETCQQEEETGRNSKRDSVSVTADTLAARTSKRSPINMMRHLYCRRKSLLKTPAVTLFGLIPHPYTILYKYYLSRGVREINEPQKYNQTFSLSFLLMLIHYLLISCIAILLNYQSIFEQQNIHHI